MLDPSHTDPPPGRDALPIYRGVRAGLHDGPVLDRQARRALTALNTLVPSAARLQQGYAHSEREAAYADAVFLDQGRLHRFVYRAENEQETHHYVALPHLIEPYRPYILLDRPGRIGAHYDAREYRYRLVQNEQGIHLRERDDLPQFLRPVDDGGIPDFSQPLPEFDPEVIELIRALGVPWWRRPEVWWPVTLLLGSGIVFGAVVHFLTR